MKAVTGAKIDLLHGLSMTGSGTSISTYTVVSAPCHNLSLAVRQHQTLSRSNVTAGEATLVRMQLSNCEGREP